MIIVSEVVHRSTSGDEVLPEPRKEIRNWRRYQFGNVRQVSLQVRLEPRGDQGAESGGLVRQEVARRPAV